MEPCSLIMFMILENEPGAGLIGPRTRNDLIFYRRRMSFALPFVMI